MGPRARRRTSERRSAASPSQASAAAHDVDAHLANGEECRYCPVCRAVQVFRSASPEVREHLATAATSLAQAAAAALATTVPERPAGAVSSTST